jgi:putative glutamine amidotransferase
MVTGINRESSNFNAYDAIETQGTKSLDSLQTKPLKKLTQQDWNQLYSTYCADETSEIDLHSILLREGFSTELEGIEFLELKNMAVQQITFRKCHFPHKLKHVRFKHVCFEKCALQNKVWKQAHIEDSTFRSCSLADSIFFQLSLKNTTFEQCDLSRSLFNEATLKSLVIRDGKLSETNFLQAVVENGELLDCDLTNTHLLDTKKDFLIRGGIVNHFTKPVVALGWEFSESLKYTSLIKKALQDNGALVLLYNQRDLSTLGQIALNNEMRSVPHSLEPHSSSLKAASSDPTPEMKKAQKLAALILSHSHGLLLPGGEHIESCYYESSSCLYAHHSFRTLLEIALLCEAQKRAIPTLGICRGAQLINVFFGGRLHYASTPWGESALKWTSSPYAESFRTRIGESFKAKSAHAQAAEKIGEGLHVILQQNNVPKFLVSQDGNFMASQIHPEAYISKARKIKKQLGEKAYQEFMTTDHYQHFLKAVTAKIQKVTEEQGGNTALSLQLWKIVKKNLEEKLNDSANDRQFILANKMIYQIFMEKVTETKNLSQYS